ncbi:MAG: carboxylesterase family protein, partial [Paludibacteraceae bacterium]|nr:carboxylesterase family protein [Paludibacteraceae bacterium]
VAAPQPPQYGFSYLPMTLDDDVETGEYCLRLSIYTPDTTGRRPVLVWIHGGALVGGS